MWMYATRHLDVRVRNDVRGWPPPPPPPPTRRGSRFVRHAVLSSASAVHVSEVLVGRRVKRETDDIPASRVRVQDQAEDNRE